MLRAMRTAASGMRAQQLYLDTVAHNLANVNTSGYKRTRVDFEDLLYQTLVPPTAAEGGTTGQPVPLQVGHGSRPTSTEKIYAQGDTETTGNPLDVLIQGAEEFLDVDLGLFLLAILEDPDAEIRQLALGTLGDNEPSPEMLGPIIQRLLHDPDDDVRAAAAGALGYFVLAGELDELDAALAMRAEAVLISVLTEPAEPPAVQRRALESLAYSGEVGVRQFIEDAYYSSDEELRVGALVAMGRSSDTRWRRLVRAELRNPSAPMRAEAAIACGELEAKSALPDLLDLLEDADFTVRVAAIFALGRLGGKSAQRALAAIAASDADEAEAAELALEEMLFYAGEDAATLPLIEEADEEEGLDDLDPWDEWADDDEDDDLGEYE